MELLQLGDKATGNAPRGKRTLWLLNIQVGTRSISLLMWSVETGSMESARPIITDLLTIRANRDSRYYRIDTLFVRHPEIIQTPCQEARGLMPIMFDGLIWRSRDTENRLRRVTAMCSTCRWTSMATYLWPPIGLPTTATPCSSGTWSSPW